MMNLSYHKTDFGLDAEWVFTATSHSKSACDGNKICPLTQAVLISHILPIIDN
jgi:hypothetical protein